MYAQTPSFGPVTVLLKRGFHRHICETEIERLKSNAEIRSPIKQHFQQAAFAELNVHCCRAGRAPATIELSVPLWGHYSYCESCLHGENFLCLVPQLQLEQFDSLCQIPFQPYSRCNCRLCILRLFAFVVKCRKECRTVRKKLLQKQGWCSYRVALAILLF